MSSELTEAHALNRTDREMARILHGRDVILGYWTTDGRWTRKNDAATSARKYWVFWRASSWEVAWRSEPRALRCLAVCPSTICKHRSLHLQF